MSVVCYKAGMYDTQYELHRLLQYHSYWPIVRLVELSGAPNKIPLFASSKAKTDLPCLQDLLASLYRFVIQYHLCNFEEADGLSMAIREALVICLASKFIANTIEQYLSQIQVSILFHLICVWSSFPTTCTTPHKLRFTEPAYSHCRAESHRLCHEIL